MEGRFGPALRPPFLVDRVDPVQNSGGLIFAVKSKVFLQFSWKMVTIFGFELAGALLAPRWPQMQFGSPLEFQVEASLEHVLAPKWAK